MQEYEHFQADLDWIDKNIQDLEISDSESSIYLKKIRADVSDKMQVIIDKQWLPEDVSLQIRLMRESGMKPEKWCEKYWAIFRSLFEDGIRDVKFFQSQMDRELDAHRFSKQA